MVIRLFFRLVCGCHQLSPKLEVILYFASTPGRSKRQIERPKTSWKRIILVGIFGIVA